MASRKVSASQKLGADLEQKMGHGVPVFVGCEMTDVRTATVEDDEGLSSKHDRERRRVP